MDLSSYGPFIPAITTAIIAIIGWIVIIKNGTRLACRSEAYHISSQLSDQLVVLRDKAIAAWDEKAVISQCSEETLLAYAADIERRLRFLNERYYQKENLGDWQINRLFIDLRRALTIHELFLEGQARHAAIISYSAVILESLHERNFEYLSKK